MPNRILREGILSSERVDQLTCPEEVFYRRLMSVVDDFGRFSGNPKLLRAALYPLRLDKVSDAEIEKCLAATVKARLVNSYVVGGTRFIEIIDFRQTLRAMKSKYPSPQQVTDCLANAKQMHSTCEADAPQTHRTCEAPASGGGVGGGGEKRTPKRVFPFETWYKEYPRKVNKEAAKKFWERLTEDEKRLATECVKEYAKAVEGYDYIPYPGTWINAKKWMDDHAEWSRWKHQNGNGNGRPKLQTDQEYVLLSEIQKRERRPVMAPLDGGNDD